MNAEERIREYYAALRAGEPLGPFFADDQSVVKYGISDRLAGGSAVKEGLDEQTERTTEWVVDSENLVVYDGGEYAAFSDEVRLAWTDTVADERFGFDTRWSGTLERRSADPPVFVGMHVSTAREFR